MRVITRTSDQVRDLRRALRITQREFAERLQVSRRTIIRGERRSGDRQSVTPGRHSVRQRGGKFAPAGSDTQRVDRGQSVTFSRSDTSRSSSSSKVSRRRPRRGK